MYGDVRSLPLSSSRNFFPELFSIPLKPTSGSLSEKSCLRKLESTRLGSQKSLDVGLEIEGKEEGGGLWSAGRQYL